MKRAPTRTASIAHRPARVLLATLWAIAVLMFASRGPAPGTGAGLGISAGPPIVAAASPEPSAPGGDTRSAGEGPGLVGAPFLAIVAVLALGLVAAGATLVYLRLAGGPAGRGAEARADRGNGRIDRRP